MNSNELEKIDQLISKREPINQHLKYIKLIIELVGYMNQVEPETTKLNNISNEIPNVGEEIISLSQLLYEQIGDPLMTAEQLIDYELIWLKKVNISE